MKRGRIISLTQTHDKLSKKASRGRVTCKGTVGSIRKGQITIFIILGIAILLIALLIYYFPQIQNKIQFNNINTINTFIESCIEETAKQSIDTITIQGGYSTPPELNISYLYINIPYYWHEQKSYLPNIETIEKELSKNFNKNFPLCINNFKSLENINAKIKTNNPTSTFKILDNKIQINLNYPIQITKDSKITQLEEFNTEIKTEFKKAYNMTEKIIQEQRNYPNSIPLSFITNLAYDNEFEFSSISIGEEDIIYFLIFKENKKTLIYSYASKYNWEVIE